MERTLTLAAAAALWAAAIHGASLLDDFLEKPPESPKASEGQVAEEVSSIGTPPSEDFSETATPTPAALLAVTSKGDLSVANGENIRKHIENPMTLSIRGGGGSNASCGSIEWNQPIGDSTLDFNIRGFSCRTRVVADSYTFREEIGWRHYRYRTFKSHSQQENSGGDAVCIWRPLRGRIFSPYAGLGVRYEAISCHDEKMGIEPKRGLSAAGRIGLQIDIWRLSITGEYIAGSESKELIGDLSFYLSRRMKLHAFAENIDLDLKSGTAFGGGLSWDF